MKIYIRIKTIYDKLKFTYKIKYNIFNKIKNKYI